MKQEVLTLPEQLISHQVFMGFVLLYLMFSVYEVFRAQMFVSLSFLY